MNRNFNATITIFVFITYFLFTSSSVNAELVYGIDISVYENTSVYLNDIEVKPGEADRIQEVDFGLQDFYVIQLMDENYYKLYETYFLFNKNFSKMRRYLFLPHNLSIRYLNIFYNGYEDLKLSVDLREKSCNNNGLCDPYETYYSCPWDCKKCSKDGICNEDCSEGEDPDCEVMEKGETEGFDLSDYSMWIILAIIILVIIIFAALIKRRGKKSTALPT